MTAYVYVTMYIPVYLTQSSTVVVRKLLSSVFDLNVLNMLS